MAELFYKEERDRDFFRACELVRSKNISNISVSQIISKAIIMPAKSFYLHPREYSNIIRGNRKNLPKNFIKRELHLEIICRCNAIKMENPELKISSVAKIIENQSAPRFYISERRAIDLYYELLKKQPRLI